MNKSDGLLALGTFLSCTAISFIVASYTTYIVSGIDSMTQPTWADTISRRDGGQ